MERTKVLVIEDNENLRELYMLSFAQKSFEVEWASDGLSGITKAADIRPDIILLDLMMPNMNGFEVLKGIRENTSLETAIFVTSNLNDEKNISKAIAEGATDFFRKTEHTPQEMVQKIEDYIKHTYKKNIIPKSRFSEKKILIIEDNPDQADLLSLALQQKNFNTDIATDGIEGVSKAMENKPDLILLDLVLPDMDGFEVLESLNNSEIDIPVLITSQLESPDKIKKAKDLGARDFVKKIEYTPDQIGEKVVDFFELED